MVVSGVDISPILALDADSRLLVIWELQKSIDAETEAFELNEEQMAELQRRVEDARANPNIGIPWEEVQAAAAKRRLARRGE
jgi:putative addiction module component (TIGR02574 family)